MSDTNGVPDLLRFQMLDKGLAKARVIETLGRCELTEAMFPTVWVAKERMGG